MRMPRFLVRFANEFGHTNTDCAKLTEKAREMLSGKQADIGNLRVSSKAIELDLFVSSPAEVDEKANLIGRILGRVIGWKQLDLDSEQPEKSAAIEEAKQLFNEERFWETHEVLEAVWKSSQGLEKQLLQGIILVSTALVHYQKNKLEVCISELKRALPKLEWNSRSYFGIDLQALTEHVQGIISSGRIILFKI